MSFKEAVLAKLRELAKKYKHPNPLCEWIEEQVISEAIALVKSIPEYSGWIPVSERFPKENQTVVVKWCGWNYEVATKETTDDWHHVFRLWDGYRNTFGVHNFEIWKSLP